MALKNNILTELERARGTYLSGQMLAERFSVSRAAVWKAIKTLIAEGNAIVAGTNQGYLLKLGSDCLSKEGIYEMLGEARGDSEIEILQTVDSTNNELKRRHAIKSNFILLAEEQTAGRGRSGKSFFSPPRTSIYISFWLSPSKIKLKTGLVTTAAAVAVSRAIWNSTNIRTEIKWVNDLYCCEKKVCGILTEAVTSMESGELESIVLGIGVNCNLKEAQLPQELKGIVGALNTQTPRNAIAAEIIKQVQKEVYAAEPDEILSYARKNSYLLGKTITYSANGVEITGIAQDLDSEGHLIVQRADGTKTELVAGMVSVKRKD